MEVVGELINASRKKIGEAIKARDTEFIQETARQQRDSGADYIDVNAGTFVGKEKECVEWLIQSVQQVVDAPCCIDSPDPEVVDSALRLHQGAPIINSISLESERYNALLPIVTGNECKVVALCMSDQGMPESAEDRFSIAEKLVNSLVQKGVSKDNIYVDPLVQPVSTNDSYGVEFLKAIERIMTELDGVHTICGLSNISYGLPKRHLLNRNFAVMGVLKGLDCAIINPLDSQLMADIKAAEVLAGRDTFCMNFLEAYRAGKLD
ncbi:MAG: methyltetrahydrofolate cobalamin methyltransferase [Desulfohalobiaceae bacterium]|nr:methyltetrahydrofolate cobalamin methyltransferase [Desulfohalobiaceae bacterium]